MTHYLTAAQGGTTPPARFAAVVVRRNPMAGLVPEASELHTAADLAGRRVGAPPGSRLVAEYEAALAQAGIGAPALVPVEYMEAPAALARGEIEVVADFVDLVPRTRRLAGIPIRAVPVGPDVYASGLVVADRLPLEQARRLRDAVVAALHRQRLDPRSGLAELRRRYPEVDPDEALEGWSLAEPNIFTSDGVGHMDGPGWDAAVAFTAAAHGFTAPAPEAIYRPELAVGPSVSA